MYSLLQKKLNLAHLISAEYIHDEAWSEDDLDVLSKKTAFEIVQSMVEEMWNGDECPICVRRFVTSDNNIEHAPDCRMVEWLQLQDQSQAER